MNYSIPTRRQIMMLRSLTGFPRTNKCYSSLKGWWSPERFSDDSQEPMSQAGMGVLDALPPVLEIPLHSVLDFIAAAAAAAAACAWLQAACKTYGPAPYALHQVRTRHGNDGGGAGRCDHRLTAHQSESLPVWCLCI